MSHLHPLQSTTCSCCYWWLPQSLALPSATGSTLCYCMHYPLLLALPSATGSTLCYWLYPLYSALMLASRYFLSACSFSRTCSSCVLIFKLFWLALYLAIYLRLWQHYLNYNVLPKALTTLTILHCSMSLSTLASIHQYIHTSISNINNTATHTLTCNMINNNIACNIIEMFFIIHTLTDSLTHCACVLRVALASTYYHWLTLLYCAYVVLRQQIHSNIANIHPSIAKTTDGTPPYAIESVASMVTTS